MNLIKGWFRWLGSFYSQPHKASAVQSPLFEQLIAKAQTDYNHALQQLKTEYKIDRYRWRYSTQTRQLHFVHNKQTLPHLSAKAQIIGSYFKASQTFEWAWNTPNVPKACGQAARRVRRFGRYHGQPILYTGAMHGFEQKKNCHYYAAIALYVNKAQFIYQGESEDQIVFFLIQSKACIQVA